MVKETTDYDDYLNFKGWSSLFSYDEAQSLQFADIFKGINLSGSHILEIGFGSGALMLWLKEQGAIVSGIEIIPELIVTAEQNGFDIYSSLDVVPRNFFEIVVALDVFEHIERIFISDYITKIDEALLDGGLLLARFPNCQSPSGVFTQFGDPTHVSQLSIPIFKHHADVTGLALIGSREGLSVQRYAEGPIKKLLSSFLRSMSRLIVRAALGSGPVQLWGDVIVVMKRISR